MEREWSGKSVGPSAKLRAAMRRWLGLAALMLLLAGCAGTGPVERMRVRLELFQSVAGEPVASFHFWNLDRWEALGTSHVAVWTRLDTAFLIEVRQPCSGLDFAQVIALSSTQNRVYARFDRVLFERQECRIAEIRPIDVKALKAAEKAARPAD